MMQIDPSLPGIWWIVFSTCALLILIFQLVWILKSHVSKNRKLVKCVLNSLVGLSLIIFMMNPSWDSSSSSEPVIIHPKGFSKERINFFKDSLGVKKQSEIQKYQGAGNPVYLIGQNYSVSDLNRLSGKSVHLIPSFEENELAYLTWKGMVRTGEIQKVSGKIKTQNESLVALKRNDQVIASDSVSLEDENFDLEIPVSIAGRNEFELFLNDSAITEVKFFSTPSPARSYSLRFSFPDPELKTLGQYLIKKGEKVEEQIQISKSSEILSNLNELDSLPILISDIEQLKSRRTSADLKTGVAGVLVLTTHNPELEVRELNNLFKTNFELIKSSAEEYRVLESGIEALPYSFVPKSGQQLILENSIAVQHVGDFKVGISLINQTFPKYLSGDTLSYERIWDEIISEITPDDLENWDFKGPIFSNHFSQIKYNGIYSEKKTVSLGSDSIAFQQDPINELEKRIQFVLPDSGWVTLADSMEVYFYTEQKLRSIQNEMGLADFLKTLNQNDSDLDLGIERKSIPDWIWLAILLVSLGLLWLEPKINY